MVCRLRSDHGAHKVPVEGPVNFCSPRDGKLVACDWMRVYYSAKTEAFSSHFSNFCHAMGGALWECQEKERKEMGCRPLRN